MTLMVFGCAWVTNEVSRGAVTVTGSPLVIVTISRLEEGLLFSTARMSRATTGAVVVGSGVGCATAESASESIDGAAVRSLTISAADAARGVAMRHGSSVRMKIRIVKMVGFCNSM